MYPSKRVTSNALMSMAPELFHEDTIKVLTQNFEKEDRTAVDKKKTLISSLMRGVLSTVRFGMKKHVSVEQPSLVVDVRDGEVPETAPAPQRSASSTIAWEEKADEIGHKERSQSSESVDVQRISLVPHGDGAAREEMGHACPGSNKEGWSGNNEYNLNPTKTASRELSLEDMCDHAQPHDSDRRNHNPPGSAMPPKKPEAPSGASGRPRGDSTHRVRRFFPAPDPGVDQPRSMVQAPPGERMSQKDMSPTTASVLLSAKRRPKAAPKAASQVSVSGVGAELGQNDSALPLSFIHSPVIFPPPPFGILTLACAHTQGRMKRLVFLWKQTNSLCLPCRQS
jgi:hypothetical protein